MAKAYGAEVTAVDTAEKREMLLSLGADTVIDYTVAGTATSGSDYVALSGQVTILAGDTTATITVPVADDSLVEGTENVNVTLTNIASSEPGVALGVGKSHRPVGEPMDARVARDDRGRRRTGAGVLAIELRRRWYLLSPVSCRRFA